MSNEKQIRAVFDRNVITVYQAYNRAIAESAIEAQTFVPPAFKMDRMTWIKPSFLWMMYRSGWATKPNQEHILAIKITREGFEWALQNGCLSHFDPKTHSNRDEWRQRLKHSPVRIQWDPERDIHLNKLDYRTIQIGLSGPALKKYVDEWISEIKDVTADCRKIHALISEDLTQAQKELPKESAYPIHFHLST